MFILFISFIVSKGIYVYDAFSSGDMMNFGKSIQSELLGSNINANSNSNNNGDNSSNTSLTANNRPVRSSSLVKPYFYLFKNEQKFKSSSSIFSVISPAVVMNEESIFCYCTVKEIEIIDNIVVRSR